MPGRAVVLAGALLLPFASAAHGTSVSVITFSGTTPRPPNPTPPPPSGGDLADLQAKPLVATGEPPVATAGPVQKDGVFFSVAVRHGVTGVLASEVKAHGWIFADKPLPAGQPVYGVPMSGSEGAGMVWCAPVATKTAGAVHWEAVCLPQNQGAFAWIEAKPALLPTDLGWIDGLPHVATQPVVTRQPVDLPPMALSYAFGGWNKDHWLKLDVRIDWGEGPQLLHTIVVPPAADGAVELHVMRGDIRLAPAGVKNVDASVTVIDPPKLDAPITY